MKDYVFETDCVASDGESIQEMQDLATDVTYETMLSHCEGMLEYSEELGYERASNRGHGLTLKNDWAVSYHKSFYRGRPCYFFVWSAIENVWVKR